MSRRGHGDERVVIEDAPSTVAVTAGRPRDEKDAVGGSRVSSGADGSSDGPDEAITQTA